MSHLTTRRSPAKPASEITVQQVIDLINKYADAEETIKSMLPDTTRARVAGGRTLTGDIENTNSEWVDAEHAFSANSAISQQAKARREAAEKAAQIDDFYSRPQQPVDLTVNAGDDWQPWSFDAENYDRPTAADKQSDGVKSALAAHEQLQDDDDWQPWPGK